MESAACDKEETNQRRIGITSEDLRFFEIHGKEHRTR